LFIYKTHTLHEEKGRRNIKTRNIHYDSSYSVLVHHGRKQKYSQVLFDKEADITLL